MQKQGTQENEINYVPSKYSKSLNLYNKNYMKWVGPYLNCISKSCHYSAKYPIFKVIKAISKIFLLNEIEIIFLAYMIRETNWDIKEKLIVYNSESIRDVVCYSNDQPEYKSLILYLMVTSYSVKFYLNEATAEVMEEANRICPNFRMIFQNWAKKHSALTKRINPKTLNRVYTQLLLETRQEAPDFNMIVDAIIQISPAYNPEKSEAKKKEYAEIKREPVKKVKTDNHIIITSSSNRVVSTGSPKQNPSADPSNIHYPTFSSSALYDIAALGKNAKPANPADTQQQSLNIFKSKNVPLNKSESFLGSSLVGLNNKNMLNKFDLRDQEICESLFLNLKEGQSEENIVLQGQDPEQEEEAENHQKTNNESLPAQTSVINLQKGVSITEQYWSSDIPKREHQE